jgi:hypothetical protein
VKDEEAEAEAEAAYKKGRKEEDAAAQHGDAVASPQRPKVARIISISIFIFIRIMDACCPENFKREKARNNNDGHVFFFFFLLWPN